MSAYSSVLGVAVLLLHLWGTHSFPTSACPVPCLCQRGPLLNCSSLGLTTIPTRIPATAVSLNLSNNALRTLAPLSFGHVKLTGLLHLWVGSNALESLSLISEKERSSTRIMSSGEQECTSWASDLQLLSAERNHLIHLPKGLGCMKSLQILQLSHNQISKIGLSDLDNCSNLKELHLQHNRITSIHPNAFIDLKQLQLLDLSYNLLVTIPVPAYQSLRSLNALVDVSFNRWQCDCNLQTLRRWISFDTEMGDVSWQVVCASPPHHAGKDLLHLKDSELTCPTHEYSTSGRFHNMIVYEGTKISIPCSNDSKDITQVHWWTPRGQVTNNQPELLIKDITEQHAGLYVCISGVLGDHISVFDLHVYKKGSDSRTRREAEINLPRNDPVVRQGTRTQSEFDLAVSLSVIITFILAFILGVFLRPLLDKLWRRIRSKRQSSPPPPPTTSSTGPQPYVNEGYCDVEDQEQELRVGSRVTFGGITVEDQVPYYDTAEVDQADGSSESNTEASLYETVENKKSSITGEKQQALDVENHRGRADSISSSSLQEGEINVLVINGKKLPPSSTKDMPKSMEFEPIPDANDVTRLRRGSSSASSNSSQEVNFSSELRESSVDPPPVTIPANQNTKSKVPGFTTEPFSEWPSRLTEQNVDELDPELWNDSGESFSFNEGSERSSIRDLSSSALGHPLKDDDTWRQGKVESPSDKKLHSGDIDKTFGKEVLVDDVKQFELSDIASLSNSSDSGESVGGPNKYIVNTELEESDVLDESDTENGANLDTLNRFGTFEDVTLDERMPSAGILIRQERMPSAGILIKQETITLEPSDIHLTFTHGNSVDEGMLIDDSQGNMYENISKKFAICADVGLDTIPKVKRYVEFKPSKPHFGRTTLPSLSEMEVKSEANIDASSGENRCLSQIKVSPDTIQKVKRYIHFKHPEPHSPTLPTSPSLTKKDAMLEEKSYSSSSEDDAHLTTKDDNFFRTIGVSSDEVSKVKRYISFKPFDSSSTTSTNMETTTEATIKFTQPSTSPKDLSQNVKKYMFVKQHEHPSSSLPSSPTSSRKGLSGKKTKYKKRNDQSYYGSHESLPLYHVHPVYRSSINRLNRGYDTDRSISSEDEDQFMEYPRKLEITISPEMNRESIKPDKNTNKVLNIDFDNSSSSTDVFEKKQSKGLMRLRALSARLFNRHENETDEIRSPTGLDVGRTSGVSINKKPKLTKEQTTIEDSLFGRSLSLDNLPKVKRYLQFSHSDSFLQVQLPSSPPTTGVVTPDFIVKTESRRSSFSSEDDVKQTIEDKKFVGQVDASYEELPKVKRYIQFSHTEPYSTTMPLNKQSISTELVAQPEPKRPSTSSVDHIKLTSIEDNFFRKIGISLDTVPHVKRYIQFSQPKPYCPTLTSLPVSTKIPVVAAETSSSLSDKSDDKSNATVTFLGGQLGLDAVPKVKRYVQFKQSKPQSPTLSSDSSSSTTVTPKMEVKTEAKIDRSSGDQGYLTQIEVSPENIKKVKRYIQFQQSEPHSLPLPSHSLTKKDAILETRRYSSSSEDDIIPTTNKDNLFKEIGASFDGVPKVKGYIAFKQFDPSSDTLHVTPAVKTKSEARRSSTSSEDDAKLTAKEDNVFGKTEACLDRVPRVKRYIQFTHPESQSPVQTGLLSERVNVSVAVKQTRRWSTSSEEDVKPSTKKDNIIGETGEYLTEIPKVKRYIKFTQSEPYSSDLSPFPPSTVKSIKVTETEYRESTSSEDEFQENNGFGQMGASLDRIPRVKRYIEFTHPESQVPAQTTAEKANVTVVAKEQRRSSTSSEDDVKPSTNKDNIIEETTEYLAQIPKIKRYIKFTQAEQYPLDLSPFPSSSTVKAKVTETELRQPATRESTLFEDDIQEVAQVGASLDRVPKIKRYIQFTHPESQSLSQSTSAVSAERVGISVVDQESRRSSTSSEEDVTLTTKEDDVFGHIGASLDKIPKVKRYIQFTKPESEPLVQTTTPLLSERISGGFHETRSSTSSEVVVKPSTHDNNAIVEIPKVKRYIKFTQSEPSQGLAPFPIPSTVKSIKVTESRESSTLVEDNAQPYPKENIKEDNVFRQTEARLDRVPRVKRFIQFTHQSPEQSTTALSAERVGISEVISETRRLSISSADDDTLTAKEGEALDKIPKVKRYISFTNPESQSPVQTTPALSAEKVSVSVIAKETRRSSTSSEDDVKTSTNNDNIIGGKILDNIPKVKRYIEFTQYEPYSSAQLPSSNVVKSIKVTATELKGTSKSAEDDVQPAINVNKKESMTQSTSPDYLDGIPRVKRYIDFVPAESLYPARSSTAVLTERDEISRISSTLSKSIKPSSTDYKIIGETDKSFVGIPKVKRYIQFTHSEPHSSSKVSMKKGSALIIKTVNKESESRLSGFSFKDNIMTRESMGSSVEQASLRSSLSSLYSDKQSVGHQVMDVQPPQDEPPAVPLTSPPPLEQNDAREYLRQNSEVLQRQERRRLLQQRRTEMDKFNIASISSMQPEDDQQDKSPRDYRGATELQTEQTYSSISTRNTATSRHTEGAEAPVLRGLKTKNISASKEFLI